MQIEIQGAGFYQGKVEVSCMVAHNNIRGNLQISIEQQEYVEALSNNTLVTLVTKYIAEINETATAVQQVKIEELQKELEEAKKEAAEKEKMQAEANLTLMTMVSILENKIKENETVDN